MPRSYCQVSDVKTYLPNNIIVEGDNPTPDPFNPAPISTTTVNVEFYIQQACGIIDAKLGTQYDVPLKKVNQGGDIGYPNPIPQISALLAADMIYKQRLQGADRQHSDSIKDDIEWAHETLAAIQNGEVRITGQRMTRGDRFVRGTIRNIPKNPAEGGRTRGGKG